VSDSELLPETGQPVGAKVDSQPAKLPGPVTLRGRFATVEKLDAARHGAALWEAFTGRDDLWTYSSNGPFADQTSFQQWLKEREGLDDPYYFAILSPEGRALGVATYMEIRPKTRVVEIGHIVYGPALQRKPAATEAQYLLSRHAIEELGYRRYEWKCHSLNAASRAAALRLGFTFEGIFRQHMIVKGRTRDTAWFSIVDGEWPRLRAAFEAWLAPENFDGAGEQKRRLEDIRNSIQK
jgi:RimJ/RimL family protein N-acetyltransferase